MPVKKAPARDGGAAHPSSCAERLRAVHATAHAVSIETDVLVLDDDLVVAKATVQVTSRDGRVNRAAAHSRVKRDAPAEGVEQEIIREHYALETAETQALGRALGMLGYGLLDSIATSESIAEAKALSGAGSLAIVSGAQQRRGTRPKSVAGKGSGDV